MSRLTRTGFALLLLLFVGNSSGNYAAQSKQKTSGTPAGTFQRMIAENGSVTIDLDLNRLNGINSVGGRPTTLHFATAANSFFPILVFQRAVARPRAGLNGTRRRSPTGSPASRRACRIFQTARYRKTFARCAVRLGA